MLESKRPSICTIAALAHARRRLITMMISLNGASITIQLISRYQPIRSVRANMVDSVDWWHSRRRPRVPARLKLCAAA
jgi:hypothetical protein